MTIYIVSRDNQILGYSKYPTDDPTMVEYQYEAESMLEFSKIYESLKIVDNQLIVDDQEAIKKADNLVKHLRIMDLKILLKESDWKVTVNSELAAENLPLKYPGLHAERQAWRDEINQLETELL